MDIAELLAFSVKNTASDLHLSSGLPPMIRVDGDIRRLNMPAMDNKQISELIYSTMSDHQRRDFEANLEVDFSGPQCHDSFQCPLYWRSKLFCNWPSLDDQ